MPELPEVESLKIGLAKFIVGQKIVNIKILMPKIVSGSGTKRKYDTKNIKVKKLEFENNLLNKKITNIRRRAKNLIVELETNEIILIHLKMTGQLVYVDKKTAEKQTEKTAEQSPPHKHTHIIFELEKGKMYYNDVRQFGYVLYFKNTEQAVDAGHFKKIGVEPFDKSFTLKYFRENIQKKNKALKSVLLDQEIVVGCGNIYADEICFASNVLPSRICKTLTDDETEKIYYNIKLILKNAIKMGGSSISDYLLADGSRGSYAGLHKVYGRYDMPCIQCKNKLQKSVLAGRTTVFCIMCQK